MLAAIWLASAAVLGACLLASFRIGFGADPELLLRVNGARVLLGAAVGAALALGGCLRPRREWRPLVELELVAAATGAAVGGFGAVSVLGTAAGPAALVVFGFGIATGAAVGWALARALDRSSRWSNLGVALLLGAVIGGAAVAGSYVGARLDFVRPVVRWLLGDLSQGTLAGAASLAAGVLFAGGFAVVRAGSAAAPSGLGWLATGVGIGAAGPLAFVGTFVPRTVDVLAPEGSTAARIATSMIAGAASVVAIDCVPRLLVGGYALPFNVAATMLAVPVFLSWNRTRLRRNLGTGPLLLEAVELVGIGAASATAALLAWVLTSAVRGAT